MNHNIRIYASPVKQGDFEYEPDRGLSVNRHPREPSSELYGLLTWKDTGPALRKDGRPRVHQPIKHKDPNDAFYHAQCVHYGLKPLKTKSAAKKELMKAWERDGQKFVVPQHIMRIEDELKAAFEVANVVAKEKHEAEKKVRQEAERNRQLKRKRDEDELSREIAVVQDKKKKQQQKPAPLDLNKVAGSYTVLCPYLSDNYGSSHDNDSYTLSLAAESSGKQVWGEFDFGAFEGYFRSTSIDRAARKVSFNWRGRETGEGESTFGDRNKISITFLDDRMFEGTAEGDMFRQCDFTGKRERSVDTTSLAGWKYRYASLDQDNYERERVGRWN